MRARNFSGPPEAQQRAKGAESRRMPYHDNRRAFLRISTGALLAPFAFLGSRYDDDAEALYTSTSSSDIAQRRGTLRGLLSDAMADTSPMKERIAEVIDDQMIRDISAEYARGRFVHSHGIGHTDGRASWFRRKRPKGELRS